LLLSFFCHDLKVVATMKMKKNLDFSPKYKMHSYYE